MSAAAHAPDCTPARARADVRAKPLPRTEQARPAIAAILDSILLSEPTASARSIAARAECEDTIIGRMRRGEAPVQIEKLVGSPRVLHRFLRAVAAAFPEVTTPEASPEVGALRLTKESGEAAAATLAGADGWTLEEVDAALREHDDAARVAAACTRDLLSLRARLTR